MEPEKDKEDEILQQLAGRLEELSANMERMRLAEYVEMLENPKRLLYINFLVGISRGFGGAIGATILAAIILYFLQKAVVLHLPVIGDFIAQLVRIVQVQLGRGGAIPGAGG